jgi:hypothetical protein
VSKKNIFLFIIGIALFVIAIIFINILINRYAAQTTKQGLIRDVDVEKEKAPAPQDEPEIEPPIKPGEQLLH